MNIYFILFFLLEQLFGLKDASQHDISIFIRLDGIKTVGSIAQHNDNQNKNKFLKILINSKLIKKKKQSLRIQEHRLYS